MVPFPEAFYVDGKKVKPGTPEWHFKWSRQIQTNCAITALTFSKSPKYFYTRLPTLSWTTYIVSCYMSHFLPREIRCIIITYCLLYFQSCVCMYIHVHTHRCEGGERRGRGERIHTYTQHIHIYIPYVNRYLTMNQGVFPMVNVNAHDHAFIYTEEVR